MQPTFQNGHIKNPNRKVMYCRSIGCNVSMCIELRNPYLKAEAMRKVMAGTEFCMAEAKAGVA